MQRPMFRRMVLEIITPLVFPGYKGVIDWNNTTFTVKVEQGIYDEGIALDELKQITIQGGWNS